MTEEHRKEETACKAEGYGEYHSQRQDVRLVLCRQDEVDEHEAEQEDHPRRVRCLGLLTRQTAEIIGISCGKCLGSHLFESLDSLTGRDTVGHCCLYVDRSEEVEAVDVGRTIDTLQMTELVDRCHASSRAYIYIIKRLLSHTCLGSTLHHDTVEFTVAVEVGGIETAIVTLQRGEHHAGRYT